MMRKLTRYIGFTVAALFFALGVYILISHRFDYMTREIRVIFAVFLFLYGGYRLVRYIYRDRDSEDEQ